MIPFLTQTPILLKLNRLKYSLNKMTIHCWIQDFDMLRLTEISKRPKSPHPNFFLYVCPKNLAVPALEKVFKVGIDFLKFYNLQFRRKLNYWQTKFARTIVIGCKGKKTANQKLSNFPNLHLSPKSYSLSKAKFPSTKTLEFEGSW